MPTTTIPDVELVRVGNWASAMSGRVPITGDDLDEMVRAAQDAQVDYAPVKLGHVDPRFDGEPALGWIRNLRRVGDVLLGDLADVPEKMVEVARSAFRRRSVEIAWGVKTPGGRKYTAALSGLALLGVTAPAVKGLADVVSRYSGSVTADSFSATEVTMLAAPTAPALDPEDRAMDDFVAGLGLSRHRPRRVPDTVWSGGPTAVPAVSDRAMDDFVASLHLAGPRPR
jgi:hypothetical protein